MILLSDAKQEFQDAVVREAGVRGFGLDKEELAKTANVDFEDHSETIQTGHVAIVSYHIMYQYFKSLRSYGSRSFS